MKTTHYRLNSLSTTLQFAICFATIGFLILFLTGNPAKALIPLWRSPDEVRNAISIAIGILVMSALVIISRKDIFLIILVLLALVATAGPAATIWGLITSFAMIALGLQLTSPIAVNKLASSNIARLALAFWIGKAFYFLLLSVLSTFPFNTRLTHGAIILAIILLSRRGVVRAKQLITALIRPRGGQSSWSRQLAVGKFFFLFTILILIFSSINPGLDGDAASMHMRIVREILIKGYWNYDVTEYIFASWPLGPQLNYAANFLIGGVEAVKVDVFFQFLSLLLLIVCGGGFGPRSIGLYLAAAFCIMPMFVREISGLFIEITLCGFTVAAAVLASSAIRRKSIELVLLALLCAAGASASKLFGLLLIPTLLVLFLIVGLKNWWMGKWPTGPTWPKYRVGLIALCTTILGSYFYVMSFIKSGNPFLPFLNGIFKSEFFPVENFVDRNWIGHLSWDILWKITYQSSKYEQSADGSMGLAIIFLVVCCISLLKFSRRNSLAAIPLGMGVIYLLAVGLQIQYIRYLLPGFVLIASSITYYMSLLFRRHNLFAWIFIASALIYADLFGLPASRFINGLLHIRARSFIAAEYVHGVPSLNFTEETMSGHKYVSNVFNALQRDNTTVLMLGCPFGAYFNSRTIYATWPNYSWIKQESKLLEPGEFDRFLKANNVSHVVIDPCTFEDSRKLFFPMVQERFQRIAKLWDVELYQLVR